MAYEVSEALHPLLPLDPLSAVQCLEKYIWCRVLGHRLMSRGDLWLCPLQP
jgi:hypothetical protein